MAWMPISAPSPMVQPCSITWWPIDTRSPIFIGKPGSTCSTAPSCTLLPAPITMSSLSPRTVALNHTLALAPSVTRPSTVALSAT